MRRRELRAVRRGIPVLLALVLSGAACAPPPPGSPEALESLARRGAERRERRLHALETSLVVRVDGRATGRLPAVSVAARLAAPDRMRFQVRWLLGLLLDVATRGDTLTAWMPGERLGLTLPALADSLGVREPARFAGRALAASWQAPHEAWRTALADSAGVNLAWDERDEHWTMRVDGRARPRDVSVSRAGHTLAVRVDDWRGAGLSAWPGRLEIADDAGWVRVRLDVEDAHAARRARASWFALEIPGDARRLQLSDVQRVLSARGGH